MYLGNGQLLMSSGTWLKDNRASIGSSIYISGGTASYALPALPGLWVPAALCKVYREVCLVNQDGSFVDPQCPTEQVHCSKDANASAGPPCRPTLFAQPCDWQTNPQLIGKLVQPLPQSAVDGDYPSVCLPGLIGSSQQEHQKSADCAGPTPAGTYQPTEGGLAALPCQKGHYCPEGASSPLPCTAGSFTALTNLSEASQCIQAQPGYFASTGSMEQTPCSPGSFAGTDGSSQCELCPLGMLPNSTRSICVDCPLGHWCERGNAIACGKLLYTNASAPASSRTSLRACLECPRHATTAATGTASVTGCICQRSYYAAVVPLRDPDVVEQCLRCPRL